MNKITKKLFLYFTMLLSFLAAAAFWEFWGVFHYYTYRNIENVLKSRTEAITNQLQEFLDMPGYGYGQGRGAYLRFVDDIAMADAYILRTDGQPFVYGNKRTAGNIPDDEVLAFARRIFSSSAYVHERQKDANGNNIFYSGMPVLKNEQAILAVIIRDTAQPSREGFSLAVSILGGCMLLALALSGVLSVFLSRHFAKPIGQIARTMKELELGNYLTTTNVNDKTELGELAKAADLLAEKLEDARLKSSQLEQMQKNYISNISHELRTPITVIRSSLEAICDGVVTGEKAAQYQRQMLVECISLQRLVNDMLELSRLQNNDFPIEKEPMDLLAALEDAIRAVRVIAEDKPIHIKYEKKAQECLIEGDYGRLRQMFIAALDNAVKYSHAGGRILISAGRQPDCFYISIKDHGCGIPAQDLEHIFLRFYRSSQNGEKGSGLGLAIIKSIGERHNIDISIQSEYREWTEIFFILTSDKVCHADSGYDAR